MEKKMTQLQKYAAIAFITVIISSYLVTIFLNHQYKVKLQDIASQTMGVPVIIGDVSHSPVSKSLRLSNIYIKNPKGFDSPYFAHIDDMRLIADRMDEMPAIIESIFLNNLTFHYDYSKELGSSNIEFFYHYQQQKFDSIQEKGQTPFRLGALFIASPIIKPSDNAIARLPKPIQLPSMHIKKIGYDRDSTLSKENGIPYHASLVIQETVREWTKYKFKKQVSNATSAVKKIGTDVNSISKKIGNEALDLGHEVDKELRNIGTFLGEQINALTESPSKKEPAE